MPYDPTLADQMRAVLAPFPGISEKKMFGGICFFVNGNMLSGVEVGRYMFRIGKQAETEALTKTGTEPIIFSGRKMGGLIWVSSDHCDQSALCRWILKAMDFAGNLPAKENNSSDKLSA